MYLHHAVDTLSISPCAPNSLVAAAEQSVNAAVAIELAARLRRGDPVLRVS
jgi:hypothetical protein